MENLNLRSEYENGIIMFQFHNHFVKVSSALSYMEFCQRLAEVHSGIISGTIKNLQQCYTLLQISDKSRGTLDHRIGKGTFDISTSQYITLSRILKGDVEFKKSLFDKITDIFN